MSPAPNPPQKSEANHGLPAPFFAPISIGGGGTLDNNGSSVQSEVCSSCQVDTETGEITEVEFHKDTFVKFLSLLPVQHRYSNLPTRQLCRKVALPTTALTEKGISGLTTCGNTYCCPTCGYARSVKNANKLISIMRNGAEDGREFLIGTLTTDTNKQNTYEQVEGIGYRFGRLRSNIYRWAKRQGGEVAITYNADDTFQIEGLVKVHHHYHILVMTDGVIPLAVLRAKIWELWEKQNRKANIILSKRAFYLEPVNTTEAAIKYLYKTAFEVVGKDKVGWNGRMSISGLLSYIQETGDKRAIALYREFEAATKGKNSFYIPPTMRRYLTEDEEDNQTSGSEEEKEERITPREIGQSVVSALWSSNTFIYVNWLFRTANDEDERIKSLHSVLDLWEEEIKDEWNGYNEFVSLLQSWHRWAVFRWHIIEPEC